MADLIRLGRPTGLLVSMVDFLENQLRKRTVTSDCGRYISLTGGWPTPNTTARPRQQVRTAHPVH